jgi:CheY-like chemotaxis protein
MLDRLIGHNIELSVRQAPSLGRVKADPGQIEQVILNLAVNARDAMPQGGSLSLETKNAIVKEGDFQTRDDVPPGSYVLLSVRDNGVGMDSETQSRIFEPFFTTKEPGKGTGLGLATVYGVVKQMDGAIRVSSAPARGTTFEIYLPRVDDLQAADSVPESKNAIEAAPRGSETILLAEDQDGIRDLVREFLQRKGYTVLFATDGEDALRIANEHNMPVDLLLTDLVMPNVGGRDLAHRLRQLHPRMKVLFMSGYAEPAISGGQDGGAPVLQKPFLLDALAHKIRERLDGSDAD